jgi:hypothetical protein
LSRALDGIAATAPPEVYAWSFVGGLAGCAVCFVIFAWVRGSLYTMNPIIAHHSPRFSLSNTFVAASYNCAYKLLVRMSEKGMLQARKEGRQWMYSLIIFIPFFCFLFSFIILSFIVFKAIFQGRRKTLVPPLISTLLILKRDFFTNIFTSPPGCDVISRKEGARNEAGTHSDLRCIS